MSERACQACNGTGYLWAFVDGVDRNDWNDIKNSYSGITCWKCFGTGSVRENSGIDLSKSNSNTEIKGNILADLRARGAYDATDIKDYGNQSDLDRRS